MPASLETIELPVQGMTCGHCVSTVQSALERVRGVRTATVRLQPGSATVTFDPAATDRSQLKQAIATAGYVVPNEPNVAPVPQVHAIGSLIPQKPSGSTPREDWNLAVSGMHCASCVARVEDALKQIPGVLSVRVNLATERANVTLNPSKVTEAALAEAAKAAGYGVKRSELVVGEGAESLRRERAEGLAFWRRKLIAGVLLTAPLVALGYAPIPMRFPLGWFMFPLATLLLVELGLPFFQGAWNRLRQGSTNMDTLISLGAITAYGYSLVHLLGEGPPRLAYLPGVIVSAVYGMTIIAFTRLSNRRTMDVTP